MTADEAKTDEAAALRALADAHSAALWRYVVHLTGDHAGADDIVQETLLRAWRSPAILAQPAESTRAWMFTVARHLVIDEVRSARKRHELTTDELPERAVRDRAGNMPQSHDGGPGAAEAGRRRHQPAVGG